MSDNNSLKIFKLKESFNYQIWKLYMHAYLCSKKCCKAIENKEFVNKDKIAEALSHIRLHLEPEFLIQTQHVINAHDIWTILGNLYHVIGFNAEFLLCKDLFSITLIKCGNNVETYFSKMKKCIDDLHVKNCNIFFTFSASLILMELNGKYEFIVIVMINHIRLKKENVFKINSNIDWLYYFILDETKCIGAQNIQDIFMTMTSSSANSDNSNSKNKFKKKKKKTKRIRINLQINFVNYTKWMLLMSTRTVFIITKHILLLNTK